MAEEYEIRGDGGTSRERFLYLQGSNRRLARFITGARVHGWEAEPSTVAPDCILVRGPRDDHFVLYPAGYKQTASLTVYDGRDGHEFSPISARAARAFIADNPRREGTP